MLVPVLLFIVGLLFLIKGGDWFVAAHLRWRGASTCRSC